MPRRRGGLSGGVGDVVAGRSDEAATGEEVGELGSALTVIGDDRAGGARGCRGDVDGANARGADRRQPRRPRVGQRPVVDRPSCGRRRGGAATSPSSILEPSPTWPEPSP